MLSLPRHLLCGITLFAIVYRSLRSPDSSSSPLASLGAAIGLASLFFGGSPAMIVTAFTAILLGLSVSISLFICTMLIFGHCSEMAIIHKATAERSAKKPFVLPFSELVALALVPSRPLPLLRLTSSNYRGLSLVLFAALAYSSFSFKFTWPCPPCDPIRSH